MAMPLTGIRVCDLTHFWAGPFATEYLAHFGAEVIKVEPPGRGDSQRSGGHGHDNFWEWMPLFNGTNVNKRGCTLDLATPDGAALLDQIIAVSDVVAINLSARAARNLGVTYSRIRRVNPSVIMLSMLGFGEGGPWEQYVGFGPQFEQAAGITYISGYPDTEPIGHAAMPDPIAGMFGAIAVVTALEHRRRTGQGQRIDLSTTEGVALVNAGTVLEYTMSGQVRERHANKHLASSPHGAFRCQGNDSWLAIAVQNDDQFRALCETIGHPELISDPRFADLLSRSNNEATLREPIEAWTRLHDAHDAMTVLQRRGVPAGATINHATIVDDPQLKHREFLWWIDRPVNGGKYPYYGFPAHLSKTPVRPWKPAPTLGEDNGYVFSEMLSLNREAMQSLEQRGIVSQKMNV
ncbi:MAG: CoA transferase [Chloroflexi bacterium]|nr:CoA transferase [Chloroflexota bacterium]